MNLDPVYMGTPLKHCPFCHEDLPISEFGLCRARKDGLNLYCKACIRVKVKAQRESVKGMPRPERKPNYVSPGSKEWVRRGIDAQDKVLRAIEAGGKTQNRIRELTLLTVDEVSDAIADLMFPADGQPKVGFRLRSIPEASWDSEHNVYYRIAA